MLAAFELVAAEDVWAWRVMSVSRPHDAITDANQRFLDAINCVSDAFYAINRDWRIAAFNKAAEAYFGFGPDRVLDKNFWDVFPQGRGTEFGDALEQAMTARTTS